MDLFQAADLAELLTERPGPCVSLLMPAHPTGPQTRQDPVRFKNLLTKAEHHLTENDVPRDEIARLLKPAADILPGDSFWKYQSQGLAVYMAPGFSRMYRVPYALPERCEVASRFALAPLLPVLQNDGRFYVLAVSQNAVRLLEATRHSIFELPAESLPKNLVEALNIDEYQDQIQGFRYTTSGAQGGNKETVHHGTGGAETSRRKQDEILGFFRRIGKELAKYLQGDRVPLVFAGVEYLFPIFREAVDYAALVPTPVAGNPDVLPAADLQKAAWKAVEPLFRKRQDEAVEGFGLHASRELGSDDLGRLVTAGRQGAIATLLLAEDMPQWVRLDRGNGQFEFVDSPENNGSEDLLDYLAEQTLLRGGEVFVVPGDRMPGRTPAAAVFRFPVYQDHTSPSAS